MIRAAMEIESEWTEVRVDAPQGWQELVGEALAFGPCTSVTFGTTSIAAKAPPDGHEAVRTFVGTHEDSPELRAELERRLAALADATGAEELRGLELRYKALPREDYATSWRKDWRPFRVESLVLLPPWQEAWPERAGDRVLRIEPGGSFGSGRHATTRTMLRVLGRRIRGGERVLDAGTGSGVLSVAAALLGAESALGFDLDPASRPSASALAADNDVADRCAFRIGDFSVLRPDDGPFDVVLANIYADILQAEAASLASRIAPGGWFAFSGCRVDHRDATVAAMERAGLSIDEERRRGRWVTFAGRPARRIRSAGASGPVP